MIASFRFFSLALLDDLSMFALALWCDFCKPNDFELLISLIFDCDFAFVDWRTICVGWMIVVVVVVAAAAMAMVVDMIGDDEMEDTDRFGRCESLSLTLIVDSTFRTLFELNALLISLLCNNNVVSASDLFGWTLLAIVSDSAYSYFKTDVGLIGIDKFVLCLFSIGAVSLAREPSLVTFDKPKCTDCCLKIDWPKIRE